MWSEKIVGRCRAWTDEQLETAGVLALVYGKVKLLSHIGAAMKLGFSETSVFFACIQFIEVWRQKESALQTTQLTNLLLSNASHEGGSSPSSMQGYYANIS